jgi:hypothetical protein
LKLASRLSFIPFLLLIASCGGGNNASTPTGPPSGLTTTRALVTNTFALDATGSPSGRIEVIDDSKDVLTYQVGGIVSGITRMLVTPDKTKTIVYGSSTRLFSLMDNSTEAFTGDFPSSQLPDFVDDFLMLSDNNTVFAAVRNAPISGQTSGAVVAISVTDKTIKASIPVPHVRRLVLSHNGAKMLAFADDSNSAWVIDTAALTATPVAGFDRATWGVFSGDDSTAYILSCGAECGGSAAAVTVLNMSTNALGARIPVSGATAALLDSSNLYVAGNGAGGGKLDIINTGTLAVTKSGIAIGDGFHYRMVLASNNKLFIASRTCTTGCLSQVDTSAQTAVVSTPTGDVTGMQPIPGRSVVYVAEGGELIIYNTTTNQPQSTQVNLVGKASDIVLLN